MGRFTAFLACFLVAFVFLAFAIDPDRLDPLLPTWANVVLTIYWLAMACGMAVYGTERDQ